MSKPRIAVTMGDPAGIGPEICLKALADSRVSDICCPVIFGSTALLERVAGSCGLAMPSAEHIIDTGPFDAEQTVPGEVRKECGEAAYSFIEAAVNEVTAGNCSAAATAPINKKALNLAGIDEPGHTEILARLTGTEHVSMMLASDKITVTLATIHTSIRDVPDRLTSDNITRAIDHTADTFHLLGTRRPVITVCGLNPHAGENGMFGSEEEEIIIPAIEASSAVADITGPLPPDTAFTEEKLAATDAYIVMYHDQGLIPFKMLAFDTGVNITLGLPIVRTSADHGTAFDIAWQGKASAESMIQSILWAAQLSAAREA